MAGRKPLPPVVLDQGTQLDPEKLAHRRQELIAAHEAGEMLTAEQATGWIDTAIKIGRIQAAIVASKVSDRIIAESYLSIAESKAYVGMPHPDPALRGATVANMNEFCQIFLGKSQRRCQELAANLETLGAELYEAAELAGLGQRDYNALRALPADDQAVVKAALAEGADKAETIGLINELAVRLEQAREQKETLDRRAANQVARINDLEDKLSDANHFLRTAKPDAKAEAMFMEFAGLCLGARAAIAKTEAALLKFFEHTDAHELDYDDAVGVRITEVLNAVIAISVDLEVRGIHAPRAQAELVLLRAARG
jgi:hypothetical protein